MTEQSHEYSHLGQNLKIADIIIALNRSILLGQNLKLNASKVLVKIVIRSAFGTEPKLGSNKNPQVGCS